MTNPYDAINWNDEVEYPPNDVVKPSKKFGDTEVYKDPIDSDWENTAFALEPKPEGEPIKFMHKVKGGAVIVDSVPFDVCGYLVAVKLEKVPEKVGSIFISERAQDVTTKTNVFGHVVALGPLAYRDLEKFPTGPWCEIGDLIVFEQHAGHRLIADEEDIRLINDDCVLAVITDRNRVKHPRSGI